MDSYVTGALIKRLREKRNLTQQQLGERIAVSSKTVSKWETGRGYPDISLIEPLASALGVSVIELLSGENVVNANRSFNMLRAAFYVCPICGNVIVSTGGAMISCCGIVLPALEAESCDAEHAPQIERVEDEYFISIPHEMSKTHSISFIAAVRYDGVELKKLYPEGNAEARFGINGVKYFYFYCNRHGLYKAKV